MYIIKRVDKNKTLTYYLKLTEKGVTWDASLENATKFSDHIVVNSFALLLHELDPKAYIFYIMQNEWTELCTFTKQIE